MIRNGVSGPPEPGLGGARADLIILSLSAFAAVTTEMAPVGLLPAIGHAFGVAESTAGLLVSLYAVIVAILAVPLTLATKRVPGKRLLLLAMASYTISNVVAALAPSLAVLAAGRAVAATIVPPSSTAATCQVSCPMAAAATSGPFGCGPSTAVGLPRRPVARAGRSAMSPVATSRATVSAANPLGIPISAAASARVMPGWP